MIFSSDTAAVSSPYMRVFAILLLFAGASTAFAEPLAVQDFFRKPAYGGAMLSPNGRYLAVIAPVEGQRGLAVIDLDAKKSTAMKSPGDGDIIRAAWLNDDRLIVVIGDLQRASGEPPREAGLVAVNRDGSDSRIIAGNGNSVHFNRPSFVRLLDVVEGTNDILVTARERNIETLDVYRFDTVSGKRTLLSFDSPGSVARWVADFDGVRPLRPTSSATRRRGTCARRPRRRG
jgi:hypothetical protein